MRYFIRYIIYVNIFCLFFPKLNGQPASTDNYPVIGQPCPRFTLDVTENYSNKRVSNTDFAGKWLILDFWGSGCKSCVESFPKVNKLVKEFKDKIQFLLIGKDDKYIRPMYERFRKHFDLKMATAYDTSLFNQFGIETVPHIIWVDDKGIVRQVTDHTQLNFENLQISLSGSDSIFPQKESSKAPEIENPVSPVNGRLPLLVDGNGGGEANFLYRSVLTQWHPGMGQFLPDFSKRNHWSMFMKNGIQLIGATLLMLYDKAYLGEGSSAPWQENYGKYYIHPVLELKDSSEFQFDFSNGKGIYCYSLMVPEFKATDSYLQSNMKENLQAYFGYDVKIEKRKMPYWSLVVSDKEAQNKILTKGGEAVLPPYGSESAGFTVKNQPLSYIISTLFMHHQLQPPFIDETQIKQNIDITIDAVMTDWEDVRKALKRNGLDLVKREKEMQVLVISDSKK